MGSTQTSERVVIKDYPFWEPDSLISEYLKAQQQITSYSVVCQSKARKNITNETSTFRNGDRFVFVFDASTKTLNYSSIFPRRVKNV